ncbi:uncharacterized protein isoform X2 [Rhodnius prolixus]
MDFGNYEFQAPQYFDFYSAVNGILEQNEDHYFFGSLNENVPSNKSENLEDQSCILTSSDFAALKKPSTGHLFSMKSGERKCSQKLSSVLCEEGDYNTSYVMKQAFSNAVDNLLLSSSEKSGTEISKLNKKPFKDEAYLFSRKSKLNKNKENTLLLVKDKETDKLQTKEDGSTYRGMATTRAFNRTTEVRPFSFQERDEEFLRRKQQKLEKARQQTKTVTEFQARPVPSYILSNSLQRMNIASPRKNINKKPAKEVAGEGRITKAKFPEVLRRETFVPVRLGGVTPIKTPNRSSNPKKITKENKI